MALKTVKIEALEIEIDRDCTETEFCVLIVDRENELTPARYFKTYAAAEKVFNNLAAVKTEKELRAKIKTWSV